MGDVKLFMCHQVRLEGGGRFFFGDIGFVLGECCCCSLEAQLSLTVFFSVWVRADPFQHSPPPSGFSNSEQRSFCFFFFFRFFVRPTQAFLTRVFVFFLCLFSFFGAAGGKMESEDAEEDPNLSCFFCFFLILFIGEKAAARHFWRPSLEDCREGKSFSAFS
ncbi:hypothetical protein BSKO_02549 [Bryopsis sp. KO-2023]|nr:hypothetical protein BSKO_02549 [Bryopsis sp. KO-2023]